MKRIFAPATLALCAGILIGCNSLTEPETASDETSLESSFDITSEAAQTSLLQASGVNVDSANGFFILNWHEIMRPDQTETTISGRANAVSFGATQSFPRSRVPGVDMGEVSVALNQTNYMLPKIESQFAGVRYGSLGKPGGRGPGGRGPGGRGPGGNGGHGPRGGNPPFAGVDSLNIPFVGGSTYQFAASGSSAVPAMNVDIQAPAALVQLGGVANGDTISVSQDLTITWTPDASITNLTLVVAPARHRGRFPGGGTEQKPTMTPLDPAAGSYTITAQALQDALGNAQGLMLHLNQGTHKEVINSDGTKYIVALHSSDGVRVRAN